LTVLLIALAGLSLLIGGVVMMNILLISVTERKPEIGLRRALGATRGAIAGQFLAESMVITFIGAAIGALLGWGVSLLLPRYTSLKTVISWEPFVLAVAFALVVGLVFGVHPARRAARLNPVEALR
jgi:putative ABC transport system permease protein